MRQTRWLAFIGAAFAALVVWRAGRGSSPPPVNSTPAQECQLFGPERAVAIRGYDGDAMEPFITRDGKYLLFNNRNEKPANTNLYYAARADDLTFDYKGEIQGVNTAALEGVPSLASDGTLYFVSDRSYGKNQSTLYRCKFVDGHVSGVELVPGVSRHESGIVNFDAEISGDGSTLYFVDGDFRTFLPPKSADIVIAEGVGDQFVRLARSGEILAPVNQPGVLQYAPCISKDRLELFFTRMDRTATSAHPEIWRAGRRAADEAFEAPEKIATIHGFVEGPTLTDDGAILYFHKRVNDRLVIYCVSRAAH